MLKKLMLTAALLFGGFSFAQLGGPYDIAIGQRWVGSSEAGWYGSVRTYFDLGVDVFSADLFLVPEFGIDYFELEPYATLELTVDLEHATLAAFATYINGTPRINIESRFCLGDRCGE